MNKLISIILCCLLCSCVAPPPKKEAQLIPPVLTKVKKQIPEPNDGKIVVAVYSFTDKTGQRKDSGQIAKLSSAVTQGGESILIKQLQDAGEGKWFRIVERVGLDNLLKERQLIRSAREEARDTSQLKPILYAGMIIEGAIVSYDTNLRTGGSGYRMLGIGPSTQYQEDMVTVSIRAISTQTGEVLLTITTQKTILSYSAGVSIFKFYDQGTKSFESEVGITQTEAGIYSLKSAVNLAVEEMIFEGERRSLWKFKQTGESK